MRIFLLSCFLLLGCAGTSKDALGLTALASTLSNGDLHWSRSGPVFAEPMRPLLTADKEALRSTLISALSDSSRFIAAHVLLTLWFDPYAVTPPDWEMVNGVQEYEWNKVSVRRFQEGGSQIKADQDSLRILWTR